jgi:hypothetical protein
MPSAARLHEANGRLFGPIAAKNPGTLLKLYSRLVMKTCVTSLTGICSRTRHTTRQKAVMTSALRSSCRQSRVKVKEV